MDNANPEFACLILIGCYNQDVITQSMLDNLQIQSNKIFFAEHFIEDPADPKTIIMDEIGDLGSCSTRSTLIMLRFSGSSQEEGQKFK